jgi:hypothetical protein
VNIWNKFSFLFQVTVEATLEHPFFVFNQGWSSCDPERTLLRYGLECHKLSVGDMCISLTHKEVTASVASTVTWKRKENLFQIFTKYYQPHFYKMYSYDKLGESCVVLVLVSDWQNYKNYSFWWYTSYNYNSKCIQFKVDIGWMILKNITSKKYSKMYCRYSSEISQAYSHKNVSIYRGIKYWCIYTSTHVNLIPE